MSAPRCPGQDLRYWKPDDIFFVKCPFCNNEIEFWKDEPVRICNKCNKQIKNPKINNGCTEWCKYGGCCAIS